MKHFQAPSLLVASLLASLFTGNAHANLLVNPSFEQPGPVTYLELGGNSSYITGWKTVLSGVEWFNASPWGGAADGQMAVDLANYVYTGGGIEQSFSTTVGQSYRLGFSLSTLQASGRDGTAHIDVSVAGSTYGYDIANYAANLVWTPYNLNFTATDSSTTLRFTNNQNPYLHFADVDGVSVNAVPVPAAAWLLGSGLLGLIGVARRTRGC